MKEGAESSAAGAAGGTDHKKKSKKRHRYVDVEMDVVESQEGKQLPMMAYFPTPFDPCSQQAEGPPELFQNKDKFKTGQLQLVVRSTGNVDFVGGNTLGETISWQPTVFALGVFDKEAGSLKVVPVLANKVLRMEPKVRGVSYKTEEGEADDVEIDSALRMERKRNLVNRFGTRKAKTAIQRLARSVVKETALGGSVDEFKGFLQEASKKEGLLQTRQAVIDAANAALVRRIPPYDLTATSPDDAYPLDKIITKEEWEALEVDELIKAAKKATLVEPLRNNRAYPNFVLNRLHRIRVEGDHKGNAKRVRVLVYLKHLFALYHTVRGVQRRGQNPEFDERDNLNIPHAVFEKLKGLFIQETPAQPGSRSSKQLLRDYLISYILVLSLKVDGFESDPFDMASELKITVTDLEPHYLQIGCKIETPRAQKLDTSRTKSKVTLVVPLKLVELSEQVKGKGRGRGRGR